MTVNKNIFDVVIIGSGIAGITIGAELSKDISVCILEKEKVTSFHSTGRSFAFFLESYGNEVIRKLTTASKDFFLENSMSDSDTPILKKRGVNITDELKKITKLQGDEFVIAHVLIQSIHDPVAISPGMRSRIVVLETVAVGVTDNIQPVLGPTVAIVR